MTLIRQGNYRVKTNKRIIKVLQPPDSYNKDLKTSKLHRSLLILIHSLMNERA